MATFEGPVLSVKAVNGLTHYTDWTIAHVHSGALGWNGMLTFGMLYWMVPRLFQTKLWSVKAASIHFWIATIGILVYIVPIYVAGLTQGLFWRAMDSTGQLVYPDFVETISAIKPMWWLRVLGGMLYVGGVLLMAVNYFKTWQSRPATYDVPTFRAPRLEKIADYRDPAGESELKAAPVLGMAQKLDVWSKMGWHRRWERLPLRFTVLTVTAVVVASLFEIIPTFLIRSNVPTIASVQPYTPLELAGRDIYVAEGCYNCHSQMIRPMVAETKRYGEYSKAGEFVYDHPFQWGSRRIGPDLAREGGKQSSLWHWLHLENPQAVNEASSMPAFEHLLDTAIDFDKITDRVWAAQMLGAPYDDELENAPELARQQAEVIAADIVSQGGPIRRGQLMTLDSQAVALIAYLQRIGVDLFAPPPTSDDGGDGEPDDELAALPMSSTLK
ncbi:MAG: cytochrome-c oxidase, cbb3-type subunit II, partial [Planctomycetota bacterium]